MDSCCSLEISESFIHEFYLGFVVSSGLIKKTILDMSELRKGVSMNIFGLIVLNFGARDDKKSKPKKLGQK